jgi:hypothetical protein
MLRKIWNDTPEYTGTETCHSKLLNRDGQQNEIDKYDPEIVKVWK